MTVQTRFGVDAYARALEQWDVEGLLDMYTEDTELDMTIGFDNPRVVSGRDAIAPLFRHCASVGVKSTVHHTISGPDRAAAAVTCAFPDGRTVTFNELYELRDGRIARQAEGPLIGRAAQFSTDSRAPEAAVGEFKTTRRMRPTGRRSAEGARRCNAPKT